jgi:hypothetical protein
MKKASALSGMEKAKAVKPITVSPSLAKETSAGSATRLLASGFNPPPRLPISVTGVQ